MRYFNKNKLWAGLLLALAVSYHFYFIFLLHTDAWQMLYLDLLLAVPFAIMIGIDVYQYYKKKAQIAQMLQYDSVVCRKLEGEEGMEVAEHDVSVLEAQLQEQFALNCDLQDYIAKWCHELKLPLSASLLINEKISDAPLRTAQKQQLESIRQKLNGALLGCKVQGSLFDLYVRGVDLAECVKMAIHNNQYFLIQNQFEIFMETERKQEGKSSIKTQGLEPVHVYTDQSWLVYVLDQLVQNAIKYASQKPIIKFRVEIEHRGGRVDLAVWDNGQGILERDIRRIFERGYTGSNHHNGKYKSTGMGLYLASQILERLGHTISVQSEYGAYTQFVIGISL